MKTLLFLTTLLFTAQSFAIGCFEQHLKSAIKRNQNRKEFYVNPQYSLEVQARALFIADTLIAGEWSALSKVRKYDEEAKYFQDHGLTIVCDEMVDINDIREPIVFHEPQGHQPTKFMTTHPVRIGKELQAAVEADDLNKVQQIAQRELDIIAKRPDYNCLMRNDLRTILFIAQRSAHHEAKAKELGIRSPRELSKAMIHRMSGTLKVIDFYDRIAFPIQKQGVQIICQDFPGARP